VRYHGQILAKRLKNRFTPGVSVADLDETPAVTVLITNINNRFPLELTLHTLMAHTTYPSYQIWVADNGSTDGSIEMVRALIAAGAPIRLIEHGKPRPQHEWYDFMADRIETPLWVGLHEDMVFLTDDWLVDLVLVMQRDPALLLLGGQYFPPCDDAVEPVSGETVNIRESLSTWIFCARAELRDHVDTSFAFHKYWSAANQRTILYDQGGKLIEDLRAAGCGFACMPPAYMNKYQHVANISWAFKHDIDDAQRAYKLHQLRDVKRRVQKLHRSSARRFQPT
jgi:glycosyltransferase involved in cell wall biosynthesis